MKCHYEPGFLGHIEGKINGLMQFYSYETTGIKWKGFLHAEVKNENCLQCHEKRILLTNNITFKGISFSHADHLLHERRNRTLQCVSCHSMVVIGMKEHESVTDPSCANCHPNLASNDTGHIVATTSTCIICHFRDVPGNTSIIGCKCHGAPIEGVNYKGIEFRHELHIKKGYKCTTCHINITKGVDIKISKSKCGECHSIPEGVEKYFSQDILIHQTMATKHKVACYMCHGRVEHRPTVKENLCLDCHANEHPKNWLYTHRNQVLLGKVCDNCHNAKFCSNCHSNMNVTRWKY
ncbi:MAG: cytochrome c3 family protein [Methanosarcinales archaeon]